MLYVRGDGVILVSEGDEAGRYDDADERTLLCATLPDLTAVKDIAAQREKKQYEHSINSKQAGQSRAHILRIREGETHARA